MQFHEASTFKSHHFEAFQTKSKRFVLRNCCKKLNGETQISSPPLNSSREITFIKILNPSSSHCHLLSTNNFSVRHLVLKNSLYIIILVELILFTSKALLLAHLFVVKTLFSSNFPNFIHEGGGKKDTILSRYTLLKKFPIK